LKTLIKKILWKKAAANRLKDISTEVTICTMEMICVLYQMLCLQNLVRVEKFEIAILLLITDTLWNLLEIRMFDQHKFSVDGKKKSTQTAIKIVEASLFPALAHSTRVVKGGNTTGGEIGSSLAGGGGGTINKVNSNIVGSRRGSEGGEGHVHHVKGVRSNSHSKLLIPTRRESDPKRIVALPSGQQQQTMKKSKEIPMGPHTAVVSPMPLSRMDQIQNFFIYDTPPPVSQSSFWLFNKNTKDEKKKQTSRTSGQGEQE
jgi:hypothetical protein